MEPRFVAHLTHTASELLDLSLFRSFKFVPPIPRLVDLVHAFNGVVVEHFRKRVEKHLSDSILLWRLLKLLFKILQCYSYPTLKRPETDFFSDTTLAYSEPYGRQPCLR